jgi:hypothetical protein
MYNNRSKPAVPVFDYLTILKLPFTIVMKIIYNRDYEKTANIVFRIEYTGDIAWNRKN